MRTTLTVSRKAALLISATFAAFALYPVSLTFAGSAEDCVASNHPKSCEESIASPSATQIAPETISTKSSKTPRFGYGIEKDNAGKKVTIERTVTAHQESETTWVNTSTTNSDSEVVAATSPDVPVMPTVSPLVRDVQALVNSAPRTRNFRNSIHGEVSRALLDNHNLLSALAEISRRHQGENLGEHQDFYEHLVSIVRLHLNKTNIPVFTDTKMKKLTRLFPYSDDRPREHEQKDRAPKASAPKSNSEGPSTVN